MHRRPISTAVLVTVVLSFMTALLVQPAAAAPTSASWRTAMTVTGFDREVAQANGYQVITLPSGREASVKIDIARRIRAGESLIVDGQQTLYGNCGYSYVELYAIGGEKANFRTGFGIASNLPAAIRYQWVVRITDNGGSSSPSWSGNLAYRHTWVTNSGNFLVYKLTRGTAWARVDSDWSYAVLSNGAICSSAGPATSTNIY